MLRSVIRNFAKVQRPIAKNSVKSRRFGDAAPGGNKWNPKHESTNYEYGYPFGYGPNYRLEGYELPTLVLYAVMFWTLWDIDQREPEEMPLEEWAKNEALAREAAAANGEVIQFGKYYWRPASLTHADMEEWSVARQLEHDDE